MQAESGRWISEHIFAHSVTSRPLFSELFDSGQIYTISFSFEVAPDLPESLFTELLLTLNASDELGLSKISGQAFIYTQELWQIGIYPSLESSQADILRRAQILFDFIHQFESERHSLPYFGSLPDFVSRSEFIHQQAADADVSLLDTSLLLNGEHQSYASDAKDYLFLYYLTPSINAMNVNKRYQSCIALYYWFARTCTSQILKGYAMSLAAEIAFKTGAMDQVDEFTKSAVEMVNSSQVDLQESSMKDRLLTMKAFAKFARSKFNFDRGFFMEVEEDVQECIAISEGVPCMEECRSAFYLLSGISKHLSILQSHSSQSEVQPTKESRHAIKLSKHSSHPSSPFFSVIRQNYPLFIDLSLHLRVDEAIMHFTPRDFKNTQFDVDLEFLINRTALMQPRRIPEGLLSQSIQDFLNVISSSLLFLMIKIMITTRFDEYAEMILNAFVILGQAHCVMIAEAHAYLGLIYQYKNDLSSAMHNFQRAIDILRSNAASDQHFSRVFVLCSRTMSRLLVEIEDFSAAESLLSQAETFIRDDPESHSFVSLLLDKARIATLFGDSSTAEALSRTALHVVQQVQSGFQTHKSKLISQAYTALFLSLPANRQPSEGQYYLSLAIKHYEESVMVRPELPPPPKHSQIAYLYVLSARAHRLSDANASRNWLSDAKLILQAAPCGRYLSLLHKEAAELELTEGNLYEAIQECKAGLAIILKVRPTHSDATELFEIMAVCYARILSRLLNRKKKVIPQHPTRSANQTLDNESLIAAVSPREQGSLISPTFKVAIIEQPPDDLNTSAREKWVIRHTPVVNSKYLPIWKRLRSKLRTKTMLTNLNREILLFGTGIHKGDDVDDVLSQQIETLVRRRSTKIAQEEEPEEEKLEPWILHPRSTFRTFWNVLIIILLIYTATVMPFHMAFASEEDESLGWKLIDWLLDGLFMTDVIVTCFSAYYNDEGRLITSHREIFFTYLRTWMLLDIAGCLPIDILVGDTSSKSSKYNSLLRLARLPRLYRLTRLARLLKMCKAGQGSEFIERVQDFLSIKHTAARLLSFFSTVFLCVHLMSCMWYFVAKIEEFAPDTWVVYRSFHDEDTWSLYIASVYWAFTTLCTVGYGDITASTSAERIVAVIWMMFGVYFFSFTIGSLSTILSSIDTKETILTTKLAIVDEFVREARLDRGMRNRLRLAIKYNAEKEGYSIADKQDIFYELPKGLRHEVALVMHQGVVKELSFFTEKDPVFVSSVVPFLKHLFVKSGNPVYREGDYADEVYFIVRGWCGLVYGREGYLVKKFQRGSYFGEIEVIEAVPRKYTVVAAVDTDLLTLGKKLLATVQQDFGSVYKEMTEVAEMRDKLNQKAILEHKELLKMKKDEHIEDMGVRDIKESIQLRANKKIEKSHSSANSPKSAASVNPVKENDLVKQVVENEGRIAALEKEIDAIYKLVSDQSQMIMGIFGKRVGSVSPARRGLSLGVLGGGEEK